MIELAAPDTVDTMPEETLLALAERTRSASCCPPTAATTRSSWPSSRRPGSTSTRSPARLQSEGAKKFEDSWNDLLECIAGKESAVGAAG